MKKLLPFFLFICLQFALTAQPPAPPGNLTGTAMRSWLKSNWYDNYYNQLGYSEARRKMYAYIDNEAGELTCVYSGFTQSNPYGNEITYPNPINCEHTVPQSFFNSTEPMKSDIHHLFPTYQNWNSERSNFKFAEIDDQTTVKWMRNSSTLTFKPYYDIEKFAESNVVSGDWQNPNNRFEPREEHKGDAARAIFYFYTVYPTQAGPITDVASLATLCNWHNMDPVSQKEIDRNNGIELYQGNRNPYVDFPALAETVWGCAPPPLAGVKVASKVMLEGAYDPTKSLMGDQLRALGLLPTNEPFSNLGFTQVGPGGGETTPSSTFDITGANAIVDWIFLELRDAAQPSVVLATRCALLQADGDIVDVDGVSEVLFAGILDGDYYLSVKSRNHLGVMTTSAISFSDTPNTTHDFSQGGSYGTNAQKVLSDGTHVFYEGDVNADGLINADDRSQSWNMRNLNGYLLQDSNLDGLCDASDRSQNWNNRNRSSQIP